MFWFSPKNSNFSYVGVGRYVTRGYVSTYLGIRLRKNRFIIIIFFEILVLSSYDKMRRNFKKNILSLFTLFQYIPHKYKYLPTNHYFLAPWLSKNIVLTISPKSCLELYRTHKMYYLLDTYIVGLVLFLRCKSCW